MVYKIPPGEELNHIWPLAYCWQISESWLYAFINLYILQGMFFVLI